MLERSYPRGFLNPSSGIRVLLKSKMKSGVKASGCFPSNFAASKAIPTRMRQLQCNDNSWRRLLSLLWHLVFLSGSPFKRKAVENIASPRAYLILRLLKTSFYAWDRYPTSLAAVGQMLHSMNTQTLISTVYSALNMTRKCSEGSNLHRKKSLMVYGLSEASQWTLQQEWQGQRGSSLLWLLSSTIS